VASVTATCVPTYQGLSAADLVRRTPHAGAAGFPFDVPHRLPFYRARNAIYHLCRALVERQPGLTVLAPDYNSGNEILALRAAGARLCYYPVDRRMQLDPGEVERLCHRHAPDVLYVIHYVGWPQPMPALVDLCRRRGMRLVEDCALSLLSDAGGQPLGSFGDWSVFCLYKTLPLPNGALLVQNGDRLAALDRLSLRDAGPASVVGRTAELLVQRVRGRASRAGAALLAAKHALGRAAGALEVRRANVGDIGFNLDEVGLAMSRVSARLLDRFDDAAIRDARVENYRLLDARLDPGVARVFPQLPDGVCPLFFPILADDKPAAARALQRLGIDALEFWNESVESGAEMSADARFLRAHVLELPIHQDLTPRHIAYMAQHVPNAVGRGPSAAGSRLSAERTPLPPASCPRPAANYRVDRITETRAFAALEPEWNALLRASRATGPFLTWEWLHAWCRHLQGTSALGVMTVRAGAELVAVAPLRTGGGWPPRLEFLGTGPAGADYLDLVVGRGREAEAVDALAAALASEPAALCLDHVPEGSLSARLADRLRDHGWTSLTLPGGLCPVIPLDGHTWDSYLATLGPAHRANVRRRVRALEEKLGARFSRVGTDAERREALAALQTFHQHRFEARGGSTAFHTSGLHAFHDEVTRCALEQGWLRMYVLRIDGAPAAVMYGLYHERQFYFYQHGFDDRYERQSIGLVLMALTIRAALDEGAQTFDMLWGTEPYKWHWAREARTLHRIHLFPDRLSGRLQHGAVAARQTLRRLLRRTVPHEPRATRAA